MNQPVLSSKNLSFGYEKQRILNDVTLSIPQNKISVILGANGCGKSTLLKTFSRLLSPKNGTVLLDEKELSAFPSKEVAKILGLLPQSSSAPEGIKVTDLIARGRYPYRKPFSNLTSADFAAMEAAMELMGITELSERCVDELSGGQRQRVWIAFVLAQQTDILLIDEPTTYLDIAYQVEILDLLVDLNRKKQTTIVMVLHDINLSARYADHIFAMKNGTLLSSGPPSKIITPELMQNIYGLNCMVIKDPISNTPLIIPHSRHSVSG